MIDNETLQAIGTLIEEKLKPIHNRLEIIEHKQTMTNEKLKDIELKIEELDIKQRKQEQKSEKAFARVHDAQDTLIAVMEINGMLPKIN